MNEFWRDVISDLGLDYDRFNLASETVDRPCRRGEGSKTALIWRNYLGDERRFSFSELSALTDRFAAGLKSLGILREDRVFVYMEKVPEAYIALLGIIKAGAVACPLFSGFGQSALFERMNDGAPAMAVTTSNLCRDIVEFSNRTGSLKNIVIFSPDGELPEIQKCAAKITDFADIYDASPEFEPELFTAEGPAVIHYTSGTTGKPKGAVHAHGAILGHYYSTREAFGIGPDDIYWCTADPGWITGTSHGIFGPWLNGATQAVYEGGFDASKWYEFIEKNRVTIWYTSPTAIRQLMKETETVKKYDLSSLKRIYSVGEPLNPEAIGWGVENLGREIYDTWFQTETGAIMITNRPGVEVRKGSMGKPLDGIGAAVVGEGGTALPAGETGDLVLAPDFPSLFRGYWKKNDIYESRFRNGYYYTGDRAKTDGDGYFWFLSRNDDVMKVAGHLLGPFEVESVLLEMDEIVESAVVGIADEDMMEAPMAFVVLKDGTRPDRRMEMKIRAYVRSRMAPYAVPKKIKFVDRLPKTRSGKIVRRMLKNIELGIDPGDVSTLE